MRCRKGEEMNWAYLLVFGIGVYVGLVVMSVLVIAAKDRR